MPLEYEVAETLWKSGYSVKGEYQYSRPDSKNEIDFSVDLFADLNFNDAKSGPGGAILQLLCECKYRIPGKSWLFIPDNNKTESSVAHLSTIKELARFTCCEYESLPIYQFCEAYPYALKGMELHPDSGEAYDKDIRQAVNQLRYALPSLINRNLENFSSDEPAYSPPIFIFPILITNADIRILNKNLSIDSVRKSEKIEEISQSVDAVSLYSDYADDFKKHCAHSFSAFDPDEAAHWDERYLNLRRVNRFFSKKNIRTPMNDLYSLQAGVGPHTGFFQEFLVINSSNLQRIISRLHESVSNAVKMSEQVVFIEPTNQ